MYIYLEFSKICSKTDRLINQSVTVSQKSVNTSKHLLVACQLGYSVQSCSMEQYTQRNNAA